MALFEVEAPNKRENTNALCNYPEAEDQGILQRGNPGIMLYLEINLPTCTKLGGGWGRDCRKPRNKPVKTVRFFPATEAQERKGKKIIII